MGEGASVKHRSKISRVALATALAGAFALAGCITDPYLGGGGYGGRSGGGYGGGYEPSERDLRRAYEVGYQRGQEDGARGRRPDETRWDEDYDRATARAFGSGYRAGYERGQDQYRGGYAGRGDSEYGGYDDYGADVPDWAVGTFRGVNSRFGDSLQLAIQPNGRVQVWADDDRYAGSWRDGYLRTPKGTFRVSRSKRGIRITDVNDPTNSVGLARIR